MSVAVTLQPKARSARSVNLRYNGNMTTKPVSIKHSRISAGGAIPLVCAPILASSPKKAANQARIIASANILPDIIEIRLDSDTTLNAAAARKILAATRPILGDIPLLGTLRSTREGGLWKGSATETADILRTIITDGLCSLIDIEYTLEPELRNMLIALAKEHQIVSVVSLHQWNPPSDDADFIETLLQLHACGGDMIKFAVMAHTSQMGWRLLISALHVTETIDTPVIALAMGEAGAVTRLAGPLFGSCLSFASVVQSSAPGQLSLREVREYWQNAGIRNL